jgi:hypothetical protein
MSKLKKECSFITTPLYAFIADYRVDITFHPQKITNRHGDALTLVTGVFNWMEANVSLWASLQTYCSHN